MMPPKRPAPSGASSPTPKLPKTEHIGPDDFSNSVKRKLSASTRTGQACDRCKVRKIRCDGRPGGCSPCIQNNTECKTTDRITGRATIRGHTEAIEYENNQLKQTVYQLQAQLKEMGVEPKAMPAIHGYAPATPQPHGWPSASSDGQLWGAVQSSPSRAMSFSHSQGDAINSRDLETNLFRALPTFRAGLNGDNFLGVSSANSVLSPIQGTSLSFFGMEIDLTDFVPDDVNDINSPVSYQHFLSVAMNANGTAKVHKSEIPAKAELPASYSECETYATWYFRSLHPYAPVLYKPHFMELLAKIYSDSSFKPTAAETVQVQMMLAVIKYQFSARNFNLESQEQATAHYRYSLSFYHDLMTSHTLKDVQAMTMMCLHNRNFPKPGAAWIMTEITFAIAVELGLHRSAKAWAETAPKRDHVEIETRRRVFWTLHALMIGLSGKLGRPMPLRMEDIDVEFPEPIHDFLPSETGLSEFRKCSFRVGIQGIKILALSSQMYSSIYAVRQPPHSYESNLRRLEEDHQLWRDQLPAELREGSGVGAEDRVFSLYVQFWDYEFQLLLHHPALCRSNNPQLLSSNMDICLDSASKMVLVLDELRKVKSLDIPWINCTVYLAATFTELFVYSHRKDQMTSADMAKLKNDMDKWLAIMGDCGAILGSGKRLENATRAIVDHAVEGISRHIAKKTASAAAATMASAALKREPDASPRQTSTPTAPSYGHPNGYNNSYNNSTNTNGDANGKQGSYLAPDDPSMSQSSNPYPAVAAATQYASYSDAGGHAMTSYQSNTPSYEQTPYNVSTPDLNAAHAAAAATAAASQDSATAFMYPSHAHGVPQNDVWRQWMISNLGPQDYHHASTLMALGGGREGNNQGPPAVTDMDASGIPHPAVSAAAVAQAAQAQGQLWPLMVFDIGQQNGGAQ